ncbi:MAG: helix-turn-helix transcriptional regulator [Lentisphaerae bacterium]|nr:helix-turn-helix transcriptional regulator [Lentisphaerota bacterium]
MNYFDDVNVRVLMRRFFYPGFSVGEYPFAIPVTHSIEFIRSGQLFLNRPGKSMLLTAPALFWMRRGEAFQFSVPEKPHNPCEHLYCDFLGAKADRMLAWLDEVCPEGFLRPADPEKVTEIFVEAVDYYRMDREFYQAEIAECIDRIMLEINRTLRQGSRVQEDPYHIRQIGDEIRKDPFRDFDFHRLAAENGITLYHFRRLFRQMHGLPPAVFVRNQQMVRAAELLSMTDMRIKEIVYNCKFANMMDFSRAFKRYSGMSPRDYRRKHGSSGGQ